MVSGPSLPPVPSARLPSHQPRPPNVFVRNASDMNEIFTPLISDTRSCQKKKTDSFSLLLFPRSTVGRIPLLNSLPLLGSLLLAIRSFGLICNYLVSMDGRFVKESYWVFEPSSTGHIPHYFSIYHVFLNFPIRM